LTLDYSCDELKKTPNKGWANDATQDGRCPCDSFLPALKGGLFDKDQPYRLSGRKKPHRTLYVRQADRCVCFLALSIWGDGDIIIYNQDTT